MRDITSLREDLSSALLSAGFVSRRHTDSSAASSPSTPPHPGLLKSIIAAGLYPRIARVSLPPSAIKFDKVQAGAVQRAQEAKEFKFFDLEPQDNFTPRKDTLVRPPQGPGRGERVFLHPSSVLFTQDRWKEPILCYFRKTVTTKPFLRDVTEVSGQAEDVCVIWGKTLIGDPRLRCVSIGSSICDIVVWRADFD